jgi:hypothetical protein
LDVGLNKAMTLEEVQVLPAEAREVVPLQA